MDSLRFIKMEGCRNDYIFLDGGLGAEAMRLPENAPFPDWSRAMSDRHSGVGGDGLILLLPGKTHAVRMRMWNADGSEGRLCLNGLRCAAKYVAEETRAGDRFVVETLSGDRPVRVFRDASGRVEAVEVDVGLPEFRRHALPATGNDPELWGEPFPVAGRTLPGYGVSVGNPHLVFRIEENVDDFPLEALGPWSRDARFPEGMNVHIFAQEARGRLGMRSWERGTGPTLACGSGAVAVFAVAHRLGAVGTESDVRMPGGTVALREAEGGTLILRGPAREVFRGEYRPE
jgi:diaminopimelate epimerase